MNDEGEMGGGTLMDEEDAEPPAANGSNAVWIEAAWQPGGVAAQVALLLYDPEHRTVALTRRLRLPVHGDRPPTYADATDLNVLRAALAAQIAMATGCTVQRLRSLHRLDIDGSTPGACLHVLAVACMQLDEHAMDDLLLLDIDEAVRMADADTAEESATVALLKYARRHLLPQRPLTIVVTGPCEPDTGSDPALLAAHAAAMQACMLPLYEAGHRPVLGDWHRLLARCDGVLRVGGTCKDADQMVATARRLGKAVYDALDDVPGIRPRLVSDHPMLFA